MNLHSRTTDRFPKFDFTPPPEYRHLWEQRHIGFSEENSPMGPWYYLDDDIFDLTKIWPGRARSQSLIAFARRHDCDDIACFEVADREVSRILLVHGWTPEGYAVLASYETFEDWIKAAIEDVAFVNGMVDHDSPE